MAIYELFVVEFSSASHFIGFCVSSDSKKLYATRRMSLYAS